jgi:hypothetical protein
VSVVSYTCFWRDDTKVDTRPDGKKAFRVQPDRTTSERLGFKMYTHIHMVSIDSIMHVSYSVMWLPKYGSWWTATRFWNEKWTQVQLTSYDVTIYVSSHGRFFEYSMPVFWKYLPLVIIPSAATSSDCLFVTSLRLKLTSSSFHKERMEKNFGY